jgi:predicted nucleic acid-binding Zn ribbon protein
LIVRSAKSFTARQSNAMASRKVLNLQSMSGLPNAWDVAHLGSSLSMMTGLRSFQMPSYEFQCNQCGNMAIINRAIDADGDVGAPVCTACQLSMSRIWAATPAVFKGTGWGSK